METLVHEIRQEWQEHILPFWLGLKDEAHGGFYGEVDADLHIHKQADKGGIATSRLLWSFSAAARVTGERAYAHAARHAFTFLQNHLLDPLHGGMYWMVDYTGQPVDTCKHVYAQAFAIYALAEYARATDDPNALPLAMKLFHLVEQKGYDPALQAYGEQYDRSWNEQPNELLSENGVTAHITMNTHIHVLEAYTQLLRAYPNEEVRDALKNVLDILYHRVYDASARRLGVFFDREWHSLLDLTSYGHDIEASWLMEDAMNVLGYHPSEYVNMVMDIASAVAERAVQPDGSLINEREGERVDTTRIWWVQAEAMVGFYNAFQRTQDERFLKIVRNLWTYTRQYIIDPRTGGEWFWSVQADGKPDAREIAGPWKCPYHNSRFCIEMLERMDKQ
ncbi:N-acylglucosamine 2-epimerase [Paenibacillus polymyxa]|uniref:AGE family epimerase/isomerase n=1 Tax=Paenibacillus polymyxa TaxID=1406 RepID=UPI0005CE02B4|nr:AGE family epimerase/isomerase [Paenibacillus polymyxa]KJD39286.1 N-acylglucosamine 2-epimerase [Paenibacillus polymyxa]QDA27162.1 N-acylglucosamine 2-epimerase [Paenibacillus polymyxa]RTZ35205.1 N-acylglucosamine 2-epimerase [Paenibacillus polymyxa]URJ36227.1 AGE family epimerase/isomerase [Paenibacillus polymyxa]